MSKVRDFLKEEHPTMFVSMDGKIGQVFGVSFVRTHVYVKTNPNWMPGRLWYWLAEKFTYTISESYDPTKATDLSGEHQTSQSASTPPPEHQERKH